MAEPWLPAEERLALWEPVADQLRVIGWRPGPAGVSAVEVADGLRVAVDHAHPTTLTEVSVDLDDRRLPDRLADLLASLLGEEAVAVLRAIPGRGVTERPVRLPPRRPSPDDDFSSQRRRRSPVDGRFPTVALGADLADDAALSDTARALALLEAAEAALHLHRPLAVDLADRGLSLLETSPAPGDRKVGHAVAALLRTLASGLGGPQLDAARRAADRITAPPDLLVASALAAPPAAAAVPHAVEERRVPERPLEVDGDRRAWAWLDQGHNARVSAPAAAEGTWARVFRRGDRLLLGMAPMRRRPGDGDRRLHALVVVPPTDPDDLVVDVVSDPARPRPAGAHGRVRAAVLAGREAARLARLDDPRAGAAWNRCAAAWDDLGDVQRASLARRSAGPPSHPLLADRLP